MLQFGTGVLLRGLPDYYIDKANKQGIFNGRIVVVKSTGNGGSGAFERQNGIYTHCIRGVHNQQLVEQNIVNASISRVLSAAHQWQAVLEVAASAQLEIVISNTTEAGLALHDEDGLHQAPPRSFPAKLLAVLKHRYDAFNGAPDKGLIILPTELISNNGALLQQLVLQLAQRFGYETGFIHWIIEASRFCNTLVDRIVPGAVPEKQQPEMENLLGYRDELTIMSEAYSLWAIETDDETVKRRLSFAGAGSGIIIENNIHIHRELKLRLLNGTHTFSCALAMLAGFKTVREAMEHPAMGLFIYDLMVHETIPCITGNGITVPQAHEFAGSVLDRFRNPYIQHQWQSVSLQYTQKMKMRNMPLLVQNRRRGLNPPVHMALGFAAWLLLMRCRLQDGVYRGSYRQQSWILQDDQAAYFSGLWRQHGPEQLIQTVLADENLWGENLLQLEGFAGKVTQFVHQLLEQEPVEILAALQRHQQQTAGHDA